MAGSGLYTARWYDLLFEEQHWSGFPNLVESFYIGPYPKGDEALLRHYVKAYVNLVLY